MKIDNQKTASNNPAFVIAEIGQAHDGSVGILHSLIDSIAQTGVQVIKFQMHIASAESSIRDQFRIPFSRIDATRQDYWKRMELTMDQWRDVKLHCESLGCEFLCTPFSVKAVEALEELGVSRYKVGSGDIDNHLLLEAICRTAKPVILSSGMSSFDELDEAMGIFRDRGRDIVVMQCTSEYPSAPKRWGLNLIRELKERYKLPVGLSDHSGTIYPSLAAVALGASLIEVHATFDKGMFGPDSSSSLEMAELYTLVQGVKQISESLLNPLKKDIKEDIGRMKMLFGRSLTTSKNILQGSALCFEDLEAAKPAGYGMPPSMFYKVLGRKLKRSLVKGEFIMEDDIE